MKKRDLLLGLIVLLGYLVLPAQGQGTLSAQVLRLLGRTNTWTATQTFDAIVLNGSCSGAGCASTGGGNVTSSDTLTAGTAVVGNGAKDLVLSTATGIGHLASGTLTGSNVVESEITLANNTTNDVSTSAHGFIPKAPNNGTFLNSGGTWGAFPLVGANIATDETTASTTYTDLNTTGPAVTLTLKGTTAVVVINVGCAYKTSTGNTSHMSVAVSGATTVAADDAWSANTISPVTTSCVSAAATKVFTGLTPGSTTFTAKYRVDGGTYHWTNRGLIVFAP